MATKVKSDIPSSPPNDESDAEADEEEPIEKVKNKPPQQNVSDILKRLQSTGAILKKPKVEYHCYTCDEDFPDWENQEQHLLQHVSLPSVVIDKLRSDDEDGPPSGDDWSDEEDEAPPQPAQKTPQKIDISQLMKKTGISVKNPTSNTNSVPSSDSALNKLSGLGFTIKKNVTPIKQETPVKEEPSDLMQKLGKLGGIKLKLKSDGANTNTFQVVNGLKDFKTSDDEEEQDNEQSSEFGEDNNGGNEDDDSFEINKHSEDEIDEEEIPLARRKVATTIANAVKNRTTSNESESSKSETSVQPAPKPQGRPVMKQTPKRGANLPLSATQRQMQNATPIQQQPANQNTTQVKDVTTTSQAQNTPDNVVVKQEVEANSETSGSTPLFSGQIKTERSSPSPQADSTPTSTPIIAKVKTESDASAVSVGYQPPLFQNKTTPVSEPNTTPLIEPKKETGAVTIIEINGDSNDEDDDCCVVSATPAPDVKPVVPKLETVSTPYPMPAYPTSQSSYNTSSVLGARLSVPSTEKQHSFNWNAPDTKPTIDFMDKSADDIFESLLSTKKENSSLSDASEYISLDTLGPQHSCEVCNTRFTSLSLLDDHKRVTGHSMSLVAPSSSNILPYSTSSNLLSSLLPVKQLAEQVGKLSTIGGTGPGFTHQQNVMINIQAYPGAGGVMGPPPTYSTYNPQGQSNMHPGYQQTPNSMYTMPGQQMPGQQMPSQYPGQNFMGQQNMGQYGQSYQSSGFPGQVPQNTPYSTASPLQSMQQAVYGQSSGIINNQMGPPGSSYVPSSSPSGTIKLQPNSNVRIQNVQTFQPGQMLTGQQISGDMGPPQSAPMTVQGQPQMPAPGPIRMAAGASIGGTRPRMPTVRGARPSIRPGVQVHSQVRAAKPRMPMKRPAGMTNTPPQKRRPDMLLPGKHDNEDCQVMSLQKQRQGLPMISSVQGAKDKLNLGSQISITKKTVNKEANAMANVLASRGISVKQKQKSRSPSPERPIPHIPNIGAGVSIKHTSKSSNFSIPEAKVGGGMQTCKICKKMFMNTNSLAVHMNNAHPHAKMNVFKCDECPASYPKSLQLQHHKRVFHNATGPNRELGLPVVDLSQEDNIKRLSNLGIYSFIPLANREQASGVFGIPIISVHNMQNGMTNGLEALGADGLLSLGPLKPLPNS